MVCIPGTFPGKSWDAASNIMTYMGEGLYSYTFKNVPAANYEYKITMGDWSENYGAGGVISGSNIAVTVTEPQDVTIYYSDFSHYSKCSIDYKFGASLLLQGTGILADTRFSDSRLTGIYSATVANMEAGTYSDTKIVSEDETVEMDPYTVDTTKDVTFYYDPESGIYYSNASDKEVATNKLVFDSKDTAYKSVYGAVATGEKVTIFFTFWGLNAIKKLNKPAVKKDFFGKMFGMMLPSNSLKLKLSKMNMGGMGSRMMRYIMNKKNIDSLESLREQAIQNGVEFIACQMSMDVMGVKREELLDNVTIGGVATYMNRAEQANVNLFI